jgi:hypothetical protein
MRTLSCPDLMPVMESWTASGEAREPVIMTTLMGFVRQKRTSKLAPEVLFFRISWMQSSLMLLCKPRGPSTASFSQIFGVYFTVVLLALIYMDWMSCPSACPLQLLPVSREYDEGGRGNSFATPLLDRIIDRKLDAGDTWTRLWF